ncbi:MAG: L-threonine 3-dehydrogenase [Actinobacteria bacterium]|jgi:threonine 3-dehydrogenase|nr:L-threonine 3-dehydrogenase [Actinomycetota bacterium]
MRAIRKVAPGPGLEMAEIPLPVPGMGEVLLQVKAASICGTDLHVRNWDPWAAEHAVAPLTVGHEMCGIVVGHGSGVTDPPIGTLVSVESHVVCGVCSWCRTGKGHLCPETRILGVHRDGVFADFVTVPAANAWPDPEDMPLSIASLQENFGNAVHTVSVPEIEGRKVLVTGCGPVGVMAVAAAKALGARSVYATDVSAFRRAMADRMGADATFDASTVDVVSAVLAVTDGEGVDVLLEMSGAARAIDDGLRLLKPGGEAALLGLTSRPITLDIDDRVIFKGATLHGIVGRRLWDTWYQMRALLRGGKVDLGPMVTHRLSLEDFDMAFDLMASGNTGKVVLFPDPADADGPLYRP